MTASRVRYPAVLLLAASAWAPLLDAGPPLRLEDAQSAAELAAELGCGGCHAGMPSPGRIRALAPPLGPTRPLGVQYVFDYLQNPRRVRTDIGRARMPDFDLDAPERLALALFLASSTDTVANESADLTAARASHPELAPADGERLFRLLNCAGCHVHRDVAPARVGPDLSRAGARLQDRWLRDYLRAPWTVRPAGDPPGTGSRMPDFRLDGSEADVLATYLRLQNPPELRPRVFSPATLSQFSMNKAEATLRRQASCLGCHSLTEQGGRIAPALDGLGGRLTPGYVRAVIADPRSHAPGSVMPTPQLRDDRQAELAAFLLQRQGERARLEPVFGYGTERVGWAEAVGLPPRSAASGEALYRRYCAHCHGPTGGGDGYNAGFLPVRPTAHADSSAMSARPDDTLFDGIHAGGAILDRDHRMPGYGATLGRAQIRAVVRYVRELCRCEGPAWSRRPGP